MEINYDMILKYLSKKKEVVSFESKKNLMKFSDDFPQVFKDLFGDKFYRVGVTQIIAEKNVSFYTSILTVLIDDYITTMENEEVYYQNKLFDELNTGLKNLELKKKLKDRETNISIIELLVNKFDINVIIFDFKENNCMTLYPLDVMNPWKSTILLSKFNDKWEPIRNPDKKIFNYNDQIIKKILLTNNNLQIKYYDGDKINKEYILTDNINEILSQEIEDEKVNTSEDLDENDQDENGQDENGQDKNDQDVNENDQDVNENDQDVNENESNNTFIKVEISLNKLQKMKKDDLIKYLESINKKIPNKNAKKDDLIKIILAKS